MKSVQIPRGGPKSSVPTEGRRPAPSGRRARPRLTGGIGHTRAADRAEAARTPLAHRHMNLATPPRARALIERLSPGRLAVTQHTLYASIRTLEDLRVFARSHVFAVFDFMSLLKRLQRELTCVELPWRPPADRAAARLVNEIVLGEESDEDGRGGHGSHFELYLAAMGELGAERGPIERLVGDLGQGVELPHALARCGASPHAARFVTSTWRVARHGSLHEVASAFALGREDVIPEMFLALVREAEHARPAGFAALRYYLERHIHLDGEEHSPKALALLERLGGDDEQRWREMEVAARMALSERRALWDGVQAELAASARPPAETAPPAHSGSR